MRLLDERAFAHLETWRPFISLNAGLTALAGAVVQLRGLPSPLTGAVIVLVPIVGYVGALYGTDFKDRAEDRETRPHRPIPSGRITEDGAVIVMLGCVGAGFLGAAWLGFPAVVMTCAAMAVGVIRAKTKSMGIVAPVFRSLGTAANFGFGVAAVGGPPSVAAWLFALLFLLDTLPKSIVGGLWDVEADRATGVRTTWVRYGIPTTRTIVLIAFAVLLALTAGLPLLVRLHTAAYLLWVAVFATMLAVAARQLWLATTPHTGVAGRPPDAALGALNWLLRDRSVLSGAVIAGVAGLVPALVLSLPFIVLAEWSRYVLMAPRMYRISGPDQRAAQGHARWPIDKHAVDA